MTGSASLEPKELARRAAKSASRVYAVPTRAMRGFPDFLIIGTQRGGTTSLYRYLERHPSIMPAVMNKGIHYFDTNFDKGSTWYRSNFPTTVAKALRRYRTGVDRVVSGEGSPYYMFHPLAPRRIKELLPDIKAIMMLRDPIARAHSHYQHEVARGFEELSFEDALEAEEARLSGEEDRMLADPGYYSFHHQHHSYIARGLYIDQVRRWHRLFEPKDLLVVDSGAFFRDPDTEFHRVLRFLDLDPISLRAYEKMNAHDYGRMSDRAVSFLRDELGSATAELEDYLGRKFAWGPDV